MYSPSPCLKTQFVATFGRLPFFWFLDFFRPGQMWHPTAFFGTETGYK